MPASWSTARVNSQSGQVDVTVFAYEFSRGQAFHFVALTQAGRGGVFNPMFGSVRRLSSAEATAIRPPPIPHGSGQRPWRRDACPSAGRRAEIGRAHV